MIITPKAVAAAPAAPAPTQSITMSTRDRAIAALSQSQEHPVANPSSISPEELGATKVSSDVGQKYNSDTSAEAPKEAIKAKEDEAPLDAQHAILARKERAIRARERELKAKEDAIRTSENEAKAAEARKLSSQTEASLRDRLAKDPMSVLNELGITYDALTNSALNQPSADEQRIAALEAKYEAKFKALEDEQKGTRKTFEDQQKQSYDQAVNQIRNEAKALVSSNEDFETIKETNSVNDVVDLIEQTFKSDGILLTVEEAAREVEDHLIEEAMKIIKIKKIQQRLQTSAPKAEDSAKSPNQEQKSQTMKTLTNAVGVNRALTSKERAILAFKGEKF